MGDGRDHSVEVVSGVGSVREKDKAGLKLEAVALCKRAGPGPDWG